MQTEIDWQKECEIRDAQIQEQKKEIEQLRRERNEALATGKVAKELYQICSSTTNKLIEQRDQSRMEVCLLRNNEDPAAYAQLRNWDFHNITDSDAHLGAAQAIVESEAFMWLMTGSEHVDAHIRALQSAYVRWRELGGKCVLRKESNVQAQ